MAEKKVTLVELYDNKLLISKLNNMINEGKTLRYLTDFANKMGVPVSQGTINNYKLKYLESIEKDIPIETLLDKRAKNGNILELKEREVGPSAVTAGNEEGYGVYKKESEKLVNVNQTLELLIEKGTRSLEAVDYVDANILLKAIAEHNKVNAGNGGLTMAGLQEMRLKQLAFESALSDVLLGFIPQDKHEEVLQALREAEDAYYRDLDLSDEGHRIKKELDRLGII